LRPAACVYAHSLHAALPICEDGVMHDQQIVWDLFQNYLDCAAALGADPEYRARVADMQARLAPNKVGRWGQLQEWQTDRDDPDEDRKSTRLNSSHVKISYAV